MDVIYEFDLPTLAKCFNVATFCHLLKTLYGLCLCPKTCRAHPPTLSHLTTCAIDPPLFSLCLFQRNLLNHKIPTLELLTLSHCQVNFPSSLQIVRPIQPHLELPLSLCHRLGLAPSERNNPRAPNVRESAGGDRRAKRVFRRRR